MQPMQMKLSSSFLHGVQKGCCYLSLLQGFRLRQCFRACTHLSVLLQISFVQASAVFCTTWALTRYRGIHIPNAPVAKDTAADAREENT